MDHHAPMTQAFFPRCDPPPLHPRCIPVFGSCPTESEQHAPAAEYYMSNLDSQQRQHEMQQLHHSTYEAPEEYRSQSYVYYAPCGPPSYYGGSETGGPTAVGVPGNLHATGLDLPMRMDANMVRYAQRPASPSSPIYEAQQQIIASVPCGSVGLPLAPEHWTAHPTPNGPPMLHKAPGFDIVDQHHLAMQQHVAREERAAFDWLPVALGENSVAASSAFAGHFHSANGNVAVKEQERSLISQSEIGVAKNRLRSTRLPRSKSRKDFACTDGLVPKFQCFLCAKQYCRRSTLKTHLRHHSGERPYFCTVCGKSFAQAANLTAHKRIHTGEKPFACPICCRPFSQSSSLVTHKRTHTGEKPYQCPRCDKAFTDSSTLTKHVRTHTGVKPYSCGICLLSFSQSGNLNRHMKTHLKQQQPQELENGQEAQDEMHYQATTSSTF